MRGLPAASRARSLRVRSSLLPSFVEWQSSCRILTEATYESEVEWQSGCQFVFTMTGDLAWSSACLAGFVSSELNLQSNVEWQASCAAIFQPLQLILVSSVDWQDTCSAAFTSVQLATADSNVDFTATLSFGVTATSGVAWQSTCAPAFTAAQSASATSEVPFTATCSATFTASGTVYANGFEHRAQLIIPASSIFTTAAGAFVFYVIETGQTQLMSFGNGGFFRKSLEDDGFLDIEISQGDGIDAVAPIGDTRTVLDSMVLYHDPVVGDLTVAVRLPALTPGADNAIFIYAGNATATAPTNAEATWQDFIQVIDPRSGRDLTGKGRTLNAIGGADPDGIVVPVNISSWLDTGAGRTVTIPTLALSNGGSAPAGTQLNNTPANTTLDCRGIGNQTPKAVHFDPPASRGPALLRLNNAGANCCIFGHKSYGDVPVATSSWYEMKHDAGEFNTITGETAFGFDGDIFFFSATDAGANTRAQTVAGCWNHGGMDVINPSIGDAYSGLITVVSSYFRYTFDDWVELDSAPKHVAAIDLLIENCKTFISFAGTTGGATVDNCLVHMGRMLYTTETNSHVSGDPSTPVPKNNIGRGGCKFVNQFPLGMRTMPTSDPLTLPSGQPTKAAGFTCSTPFKGSGGSRVYRNTVFRIDSVPLEPDDSIAFAGTYTNCFLCWLGSGSYPGSLPSSGLTVKTGQTALDFWNQKRDMWIARHRCTVGPSGGVDDAPWLNVGGDLTIPSGATFPAATLLKGMPAGQFNGTDSQLEAAPWASWGDLQALTFDLWVQADAGALSDHRGIWSQGPRDGNGNDQSVNLACRTAIGSASHPIVAQVNAGSPVTNGSLITAEPFTDTTPTLLAMRWQSGQAPGVWKNGVALTGTAAAATGGLVNAGTAPDNTEKLGYGAARSDVVGLPWKGKLGLARLRAVKVSDELLKTEFANQNDPRAFYGFGAWDQRIDTNRGPIPVPETVSFSGGSTPHEVDVTANDADPDATLTPPTALRAAGTDISLVLTPSTAGTLTRVDDNKIRFTPNASFTGRATADYNIRDKGDLATRKFARGRTAFNIVSPRLPRIGAGNVGVANLATAIGSATSWNVEFSSFSIFTGGDGGYGWSGYAAQTDLNKAVWKSNTTTHVLKDCRDLHILPVIAIPVVCNNDTAWTQVTSGSLNTPIDIVINGIIAEMGTDLWVARIGHEAQNNSFPWYAEAFGHTIALVNDYKRAWRYIAKRIKDKVAAAGGQVLIDWCLAKGTLTGKHRSQDLLTIQEYWPEYAVTTVGGAVSNDSSGLNYPGTRLVDVYGYDFYDADPYAGNPSGDTATYARWTGRGANSYSHGILRHFDFAQQRGVLFSIDEAGLKPYDANNGTLAAPNGGCDNPTFIQWMHDLLTGESDVSRDTLLWWNLFDMNAQGASRRNHPQYCHAIYPNTVFNGGPNTTQRISPNPNNVPAFGVVPAPDPGTTAASDLYKNLFNRTAYPQ